MTDIRGQGEMRIQLGVSYFTNARQLRCQSDSDMYSPVAPAFGTAAFVACQRIRIDGLGMSTTDHLQAAVEHLTFALNLLDQIGADVTAAHVDGAIQCLKAELRDARWELSLNADYSYLDAIVDETYGKHRSLTPAIAFGGGR